jgi:hypothetical protein
MPQVPVSAGPQVRTAPLQPVLQNTPDVSSGGRAIAQGLGAVAEAADRIDLRDAQAKASDVDRRITEEWLRWDASPEGRAKYRGANADGYAAAAEAWWEKARETNAAGLNPRAMAIASPSLQSKRTTAINNAMQFQAAEKERHADEVYNADVVTTIQFGVSTGNVASAAEQIRRNAAVLGARKGWTTEQVQAEQGKHLSTLHLTHITRLASSNPTAAQAYYDANKGEVNAVNQPRVEEVLKAEGDNQFASQFAAGVAARPLGEQLAEAAKIADPQRREKALTQIRNNNALVRQAEREVEENMSDQAWQLFSRGQPIPEAILSGMNGRERAQLTEAQRARVERASRVAEGKPIKTDPVVHARVLDMARDNPDAFKVLRLETLVDKVSGSDLEQIARLQRDMSRPETEREVATVTQVIGTYTGGFRPEKKDTFSRAFLDEVNRFTRENKRTPRYEDLTKIGDRLMLEGEVLSGSVFRIDPNMRYFEATPEQRARFAPTISSAERRQVTEALVAEGIAKPTEAQIVARFKFAKGMR